MVFYSRSDWGAVPAEGRTAFPAGEPTSATFHYSDGDVPIDRDAAFYANVVRGIQHYHMYVSPEGYVDIAYNFLVSPRGDIYEGRGFLNRSGANGTSSANTISLAICYLGGPNTPLTAAAKEAFLTLRAQARVSTVFPHNHWIPTSCPGPAVGAWIASGLPGEAVNTEEAELGAALDTLGQWEQDTRKIVLAAIKAEQQTLLDAQFKNLLALSAKIDTVIDRLTAIEAKV